jgi:hypothetical protein
LRTTPRPQALSVCTQRASVPEHSASVVQSVGAVQLKLLTHPTPLETPTTHKLHVPSNGHPPLPAESVGLSASKLEGQANAAVVGEAVVGAAVAGAPVAAGGDVGAAPGVIVGGFGVVIIIIILIGGHFLLFIPFPLQLMPALPAAERDGAAAARRRKREQAIFILEMDGEAKRALCGACELACCLLWAPRRGGGKK